ncbi:MAG: hypothetical protein AAFU66_08000 [Pseudomonadota bacterium]
MRPLRYPGGGPPEAFRTVTVLQSEALRAVICHRGLRLASLRLAPFGPGDELLATLAKPMDFAYDPHYLGAFIGPYANRIAHASFMVGGERITLTPNEGPHLLHSGPAGFHGWDWSPAGAFDDHQARFRLFWQDPDHAYPGRLDISVRFRVEATTLAVEIEAHTDETTPFNPTYHPYFHLSPDERPAIETHTIRTNAYGRLMADAANLPTGQIEAHDAGGQVFAGSDRPPALLDDCYVYRGRMHATISHLKSHRTLKIESDAPAAQIYTGHHLSAATSGWPYLSGAGLCVEPQHPANSPNIDICGSTFLHPGEQYTRWIRYTIEGAV